VRGADVTDISSKGLFPQLTDLLDALSDSHELLLSRVRSVRLELEHTCVAADVIEDSPYGRFVDVAGLAPTAAIDTTPARSVPMDEIEPIESSTRSNRSACSVSGVSSDSEASADHVMLEKPAPPRPAAENVTSRHTVGTAVPPRVARPSESPQAGVPEPTGDTPANKYNFFDELDSRLAHLEDPEVDTGDG
jgi:hypothetical protein